MTASSSVPHGRPRLRRTGAVLGVLVCSLAAAGSAQAANTSVSFDIGVYPAEYVWDGVSQPAPTNTAYFDYGYSIRESTDRPDTVLQQIRGGAVVASSDDDGKTDPATGVYTAPPRAVQVGDVFRIIRRADQVVVSQTTYTGQPQITASVIGSSAFSGTTSPDATDRSVFLERRIARQNPYLSTTQGTYHWEKVTLTSPPASKYDESARDPADDDDYPARPSASELTANQQWKLVQDTPRKTETKTDPSNSFELVSTGNLTSVSPTAFAGTFGTPIVAGDFVEADQTSQTIAADASTRVSFSVTAPAGVVPPPDVTAPKVSAFDLGAKSTSVATFLKFGLSTFATLDEPGTVDQQLQVFVTPKAKAPAKKKKGSSAKKKKGKKGKKGTKKAALRAAAKPTLVVIGTGKGAATVAGGTAKTTVVPVGGAKTALAKTGVSVVSATLVSTVKDAAGNVATTTTPVKLTDNPVAKKAVTKKKTAKKKKSAKKKSGKAKSTKK